jgi:hypothetical protein
MSYYSSLLTTPHSERIQKISEKLSTIKVSPLASGGEPGFYISRLAKTTSEFTAWIMSKIKSGAWTKSSTSSKRFKLRSTLV